MGNQLLELKLRKRVMRVPVPSPLLLVNGGLALSDSEKADSLSDSREAQYERVNETLSSVFIEAVGDSMIGNEYVPASEPKLSRASEFQVAINGIEAGKFTDRKSVSNRALMEPTKTAITFITKLFNAVLRDLPLSEGDPLWLATAPLADLYGALHLNLRQLCWLWVGTETRLRIRRR
jgi:hypothetical protein